MYCLSPQKHSGQFRDQKSLAPSKFPLKWPIKKFARKKLISRIFKISGTLIVINLLLLKSIFYFILGHT
jgi:hypothetical protein